MDTIWEKLDVMLKDYFSNRRFQYFKSSIKKTLFANTEELTELMTWRNNPDIWKLQHAGEKSSGEILFHIHERGQGYGFFAEITSVLMELLYADKFGLTPVVTFGKDFLYYDDSIENVSNAFLYYFEEIGKEKDLSEAENILESREIYEAYLQRKYHVSNYEINQELTRTLAGIVKKYITIKPEIENRIIQEFKELVGNKHVLGIHYRGTDYTVGYEGHPTVVQLNQICDLINEELLAKYDYIFFATDDSRAYEYINEKYAGIIRGYNNTFRAKGDESVAFSKGDRLHHKYLLGYEVLRDMLSLSYCDALIAGFSQVSKNAQIFKKSRGEEYADLFIINNGINHTGLYFDTRRKT